MSPEPNYNNNLVYSVSLTFCCFLKFLLYVIYKMIPYIIGAAYISYDILVLNMYSFKYYFTLWSKPWILLFFVWMLTCNYLFLCFCSFTNDNRTFWLCHNCAGCRKSYAINNANIQADFFVKDNNSYKTLFCVAILL